ncbi:MAG: HlyC/CorC family transporter, partial [Planctomycetota bacterium]|nr:HlyC/CorC family transporter [Planctomycetota bacterium]
GRLSVREWRELFGVSRALPPSATLGGLVTSIMGRMARPGDRVRLENLELTVISARRNRIDEVRVRLAEADAGGREGGR